MNPTESVYTATASFARGPFFFGTQTEGEGHAKAGDVVTDACL